MQTTQRDRPESLLEHHRRVDHALRRYLGFGIMVWRALESIVSLGSLALAAYAINEGADPLLALTLAAIIISGPKVAEWWLVREDYVEYEEVRQRRLDGYSDDDDA